MTTTTRDTAFFVSLTRLIAFGSVHVVGLLAFAGMFVGLSLSLNTLYALAFTWIPAGFYAWMLRNIIVGRRDAFRIGNKEWLSFSFHLAGGPVAYMNNEIRLTLDKVSVTDTGVRLIDGLAMVVALILAVALTVAEFLGLRHATEVDATNPEDEGGGEITESEKRYLL